MAVGAARVCTHARLPHVNGISCHNYSAVQFPATELVVSHPVYIGDSFAIVVMTEEEAHISLEAKNSTLPPPLVPVATDG